jgi:hypothetical protein
MELELLTWLVRRWLARPWIVLAWALLVALTGLLPSFSGLGLRPEVISYQELMAEAVLLWGVLGGLSTLNAWAEIEAQVEALARGRRSRVRGFVALVLLWLPTIPILAIGTFLSGGDGQQGVFLVCVAVLAQLTLIAGLVRRIPWASVRSFAFVAFAWWLPAFASGWPFGPPGWMQPSAAGRVASKFALDSSVWSSWVGSMLTLAFLSIALDLVRRPHHEVRHPR